jgi:hypothetical protein
MDEVLKDKLGPTTKKVETDILKHQFQLIVSEAHPAPNLIRTRGSFPGGKAVGA